MAFGEEFLQILQLTSLLDLESFITLTHLLYLPWGGMIHGDMDHT